MASLFTGTTQSGKTTLARHMARAACKKGELVIVRDPVAGTATAGGDWGDKAEIYSDDELFMARLLDLIESKTPAHIYIDEAGDLFGMSQRENFWLATRGRHYGFEVSFITQRPKLIAPSVRGQCSRVFMFRLSTADMREVLADCGHDLSIIKTPLDKGDFLALNSGSAQFARANVFTLLKSKKEPKP
jgi:energy-coupling factor transporter ATP-binding protein EcfA2